MSRGMKVHTVTAVVLCLAILTTGACISRSTYDTAVADLEAKNAELDRTRTQSQVLTERVSKLQQLKIDLARQMEAASSVLQQAKQQMKTEHTASQERLSKLNRIISQLTAEQNNLLYALQRANEERFALQSIAEKYTSKLSEADGPRAPLSAPPIVSTNEPTETALAPSAQVAVQTDSTAANPKPQPASKPTSEPVEEDWLSMLKAWIISLWRSIFS